MAVTLSRKLMETQPLSLFKTEINRLLDALGTRVLGIV